MNNYCPDCGSEKTVIVYASLTDNRRIIEEWHYCHLCDAEWVRYKPSGLEPRKYNEENQ